MTGQQSALLTLLDYPQLPSCFAFAFAAFAFASALRPLPPASAISLATSASTRSTRRSRHSPTRAWPRLCKVNINKGLLCAPDVARHLPGLLPWILVLLDSPAFARAELGLSCTKAKSMTHFDQSDIKYQLCPLNHEINPP